MAEPYNFENCGTNDPPEILDVTFNVNGIAGTPDSSGAGDQTNPPIIGSNVQVIATWTNEDSEEIVNYQFFLDGSGTVVPSIDSIASITDESLAGETLLCTVTVSNSIGSAEFTINMGVVYGLPPELPSTINSFLTVIPPINSVVAPGNSVSVTYTPQINQLGAPNINSITTIVNGQSFTGTSFTYTVSADESPNGCEIKIEQVDVSNVTEGVPNTGTDSKSYNLKIATVQSPIAGQPCGEALGRCCWTGGFDSVTGITTGNCDILTSGACDAVNGVWTEGVLECPTCDGSVGTPCCDEIGTGRCCCVQTDNTGLCIDGLTFGECDSLNPLFANCGGSEEFPDIVWSHNQNCSSSTEPPCQGPPTGRCCEVFADGSGTTCAIGLEQLDCPRYLDSTDFAWTPDGNCPDCTVPSQNFGEPCCEPLGRCCLLGDIDSDGFNESLQTPNITERACNQLASDNGYTSINWTQNTPGQSSTNINCNNFGTANANLSCCLPRGRCCWKESNGSGNFQLNVTEEECSVLAGSNPRQWSFGINTSPNCSGNQLSTNLCCDTSRGRCCENNGIQNICTPDIIFDNCNGSGQNFGNGQPCPSCDAGVGAPCCNGDAAITNVRFDPSTVVAGNSTTLRADFSNDNFNERKYEYYVNDEIRQTSSVTPTALNTNLTDVGLDLKGVVSTKDFDGQEFQAEITTTIVGTPPQLPTSLNINVSPGNNWPGNLDPGDTITISQIQTVTGNPDSTIDWSFVASDNGVLASGSDMEPITISYEVTESDVATEKCQLKLNLQASNGYDPNDSRQYGPWTVSGDPGDLCGVPIGRCCVTGDFDPATGITSAGCTNGFSEADCLARNGSWGEGESCPTCDGSVGTPCCPEIGTGRCCCTQTDNTAKCVNGLTFGGCTGSNPDFAGCGDSPTGSPTWFHNQDCPTVCNDTIGAPCCAPQTGRCCEILPEGNSDGLPPGVTCEIGLEEFDCPRYFSSTSFEWSEDGTCPDCTNPQDNLNNPVCCPEKLGRCCCSTNPSIFEGFCRSNVTEAECTSLCGGESPTWTQNSGEPGGLQCPDCSDPANELPCCNDRGRCCYKYEADGDEAREGACHRGVTFGECQFLALQDNALTQPVFREDNPSCPNCGAGNNTNSCCDDTEIVRGICCNNGVCDDNDGEGVISTECSGSFDPSTTTCPNCLNPGENTGRPCCVAGYPVLSIDRILVNGSVYDASTNPLVGGAVVTIETTEQNLDTVSYEFFIIDTGNTQNLTLSTGSKSYTIPTTLSTGLVPVMPGRNLQFEVNATSLLEGVPANELQDNVDIGTIHGTPPTDIATPNMASNLQGIATPPFSNPLSGNETLIVGPPDVDGDFPSSVVSYEWLGSNGNIINSGNQYTVSSDGVLEGCELKLKITADNTLVAGVPIPGGGIVEETFEIQSIIAGGDDSQCSGVNLGTCCCGGEFDPVTGITQAQCTPGLTEQQCNSIPCPGGRTWTDDDYSGGGNFCPTCDTTNGADGGADYPCCSQYPTGRCCKTGQPCTDGIFRSQCDEANGFVFEKDKTCPSLPCNSGDPAQQRCGCDEDTPLNVTSIEFLSQDDEDDFYGKYKYWNPSDRGVCYRQRVVYSGPPSGSYEIDWRFSDVLNLDPFDYELIKDPDNDGSFDVVQVNITDIRENWFRSFSGDPQISLIAGVTVDVNGETQYDETSVLRRISPYSNNTQTTWQRNIRAQPIAGIDLVRYETTLLDNSNKDFSHPKLSCGLRWIGFRSTSDFTSTKIYLVFNNSKTRDQFASDYASCTFFLIHNLTADEAAGCPESRQLFINLPISGLAFGNAPGTNAYASLIGEIGLANRRCLASSGSINTAATVQIGLAGSGCAGASDDCPNNCYKPPLVSWVNGTDCSTTDNGGEGCYVPRTFSDEGVANNDVLTPCDFREILADGSTPNSPCNINSICSCFSAQTSPGCGGKIHANSPNGKNLTYLCEQAVFALDPFCLEGEWDGACASIAQATCDLSSLLTGDEYAIAADVFKEIPNDEYIVSDPPLILGIRDEFLPYECSSNPLTPCIDQPFVEDEYSGGINTYSPYRWTANCIPDVSNRGLACKPILLTGGDCTDCSNCPPTGSQG